MTKRGCLRALLSRLLLEIAVYGGEEQRRSHQRVVAPAPAAFHRLGIAFCQDSSECQPRGQSSEGSGVVDARHQTKKQVVCGEADQTLEGWLQSFLRNRKFSQIQYRDESASEPKDCPRGSRPNALGMPPQAGQAAADPAGGVNHHVGPAIEYPLRQPAQVPQAPHVEEDMNGS